MPGMRASAWASPLGVLGRTASGAMARSWLEEPLCRRTSFDRWSAGGCREYRAAGRLRAKWIRDQRGAGDGGGIEAERRSGRGGPQGAVGEARDVPQIDIANVAERGGDTIGESCQDGSAKSFKIGPHGGFGARGGEGARWMARVRLESVRVGVQGDWVSSRGAINTMGRAISASALSR